MMVGLEISPRKLCVYLCLVTEIRNKSIAVNKSVQNVLEFKCMRIRRTKIMNILKSIQFWECSL
jgi:hypothetical protein